MRPATEWDIVTLSPPVTRQVSNGPGTPTAELVPEERGEDLLTESSSIASSTGVADSVDHSQSEFRRKLRCRRLGCEDDAVTGKKRHVSRCLVLRDRDASSFGGGEEKISECAPRYTVDFDRFLEIRGLARLPGDSPSDEDPAYIRFPPVSEDPSLIPLPPVDDLESYLLADVLPFSALPEWQFELVCRVARNHQAVQTTSTTHSALARLVAGIRYDHLSDPSRPPPFVEASLACAASLSELDWLGQLWQMTGGATDLIEDIEQAMSTHQANLDRAFTHYLTAIGVSLPPTGYARFCKKEADRALQGAIGSVGVSGNKIFRMHIGFDQPLEIHLDSPSSAGAAFGIYMARKGFNVPDPRKVQEYTKATFKRLTTPPPPLDGPQLARKVKLLTLLQRLLPLLFFGAREGRESAPCPNSGKSCLEASLAMGGKRTVLFGPTVTGSKRYEAASRFPSEHGGHFPTVLTTISSGGKLRGISLTTVRASQYAWMNKFMFERIRKHAWMVGGRDVKDWARQMAGGLHRNQETGIKLWDDDVWVSGDLAAATDNLSGEFARTVIRWFAREAYPEREDSAFLEMCSSCTDATFCQAGDGCFIPEGTQARGQLMASDFSFPILCLIGLLIGLETHGDVDNCLHMPDATLLSYVKSYKKIGVNGDDFVTRCQDPSAWTRAVAITGGVPEPTKSPCDESFFTINSELWLCNRYHPVPIPMSTILPAMLLRLHGGFHKNADLKWIDMLAGPAPPGSTAFSQLGLDLILLPDVPRTMGGMGAMPPHKNSRLSRARIAWALAHAPRDIQRKLLQDFKSPRTKTPLYSTMTGAGFRIHSMIEDDSERLTPGWRDRETVMTWKAKVYGAKNGVHWTNGDEKKDQFTMKYFTEARRKTGLLMCAERCYDLEEKGYMFGWAPDDIEVVDSFVPKQSFDKHALRKWEDYIDTQEIHMGIGMRGYKVPVVSKNSAELPKVWFQRGIKCVPASAERPSVKNNLVNEDLVQAYKSSLFYQRLQAANKFEDEEE